MLQWRWRSRSSSSSSSSSSSGRINMLPWRRRSSSWATMTSSGFSVTLSTMTRSSTPCWQVKWLLSSSAESLRCHTLSMFAGYMITNLNTMIIIMILMPWFPGFRTEYPGGGIYRHQFEQLVGNTVMEVVFKWVIWVIFAKLRKHDHRMLIALW